MLPSSHSLIRSHFPFLRLHFFSYHRDFNLWFKIGCVAHSVVDEEEVNVDTDRDASPSPRFLSLSIARRAFQRYPSLPFLAFLTSPTFFPPSPSPLFLAPHKSSCLDLIPAHGPSLTHLADVLLALHDTLSLRYFIKNVLAVRPGWQHGKDLVLYLDSMKEGRSIRAMEDSSLKVALFS